MKEEREFQGSLSCFFPLQEPSLTTAQTEQHLLWMWITQEYCAFTPLYVRG